MPCLRIWQRHAWEGHDFSSEPALSKRSPPKDLSGAEGTCPELAEGCREPQKQGWSRPSRPASTVASKTAGFSPRGAFRSTAPSF